MFLQLEYVLIFALFQLFADAEEEWKRCGANSGLHMIIFDEIDAICKKRGSQVIKRSVKAKN